MTGFVHSFQSLGTADGPGVRSVVFMQGCPLRCICCHNPDTWNPSGGTATDVEALTEKILRFRSYFGTAGGVTVSGGEPLMQTEFVTALFRRLHTSGISTALDTSGYRLDNSVKDLLAETDTVLLDIKYTNPTDYLQYTGCDMERPLAFLAYLDAQHIRTWVRQVIIPGYNDTPASLRALADIVSRHACVEKTELLPFRKLCIEKYHALGIPFPLESTPEADAGRTAEYTKAYFPNIAQ